jgi:hypothetical protein
MFWLTMMIAATVSITGLALLCIGICHRRVILGVLAGIAGYLLAISSQTN